MAWGWTSPVFLGHAIPPWFSMSNRESKANFGQTKEDRMSSFKRLVSVQVRWLFVILATLAISLSAGCGGQSDDSLGLKIKEAFSKKFPNITDVSKLERLQEYENEFRSLSDKGTTYVLKARLEGDGEAYEAKFKVFIANKDGWSNVEITSYKKLKPRTVSSKTTTPRPDTSTIPKNERAALGNLKKTMMAEFVFRAGDKDKNRINDYWTADVAGLYRNDALTERSVAEADAAPVNSIVSKPKPHSGYFFRALEKDQDGHPYGKDTDRSGNKWHNTSRFGFCAYPSEYGKTGKRTFIGSEANTMYAKDTGGKRVLQWPANPIKEGWKRLD